MSRRKPKGLAHVGIERRTLREEHWQGLSAAAKILYIHLKGRYNGSNNGDIELPYSAMKNVKGCSNPRSISKAGKELEDKEWITRKRRGGMYRFKTLYALTFIHDSYAVKFSDGPGKG